MSTRPGRPTSRISALAGRRSGTTQPPATSAPEQPVREPAPEPVAEPAAEKLARGTSDERQSATDTTSPAPARAARQQRTLGLERDVLERLRGAADSLPTKVKDQGILSLNDLVNELLREGITRYEAEHNKGRPYKLPARGLRRGPRIRN